MINIRTIAFSLVFLFSFQAFSVNNFNLIPVEVAKGIYVFFGDNNSLNSKNGGAISNTGFIVGEESILVIDAGPNYLYASKVLDIIKSYSSLPIKYLVVTHHHPDHSFGISKFVEIKAEIIIAQTEVGRYLKYGNRLLRQMKTLIGEEWFMGTNIVSFKSKKFNYPLSINLGARNIVIDLYTEGHSEGDLVVKDEDSNIIFVGDLVFNGRAPTIPHANISNWDNYLSYFYNNDWHYLVPGHGKLVIKKEEILPTKVWINLIDKVANNAANNGISPAEIFNEGIPTPIKDYKLAKETWIRDLPLLIDKYEYQ